MISPAYDDGIARCYQGDVLDVLAQLPAESVQCVVTSPPYWGLRDYGTAAWVGGEEACDHRQGRPGSGRADGVVDERGQRNRDGVGAMGRDCRRCGATRVDSQLGLEATPEEYVEHMVAVFRGVKRVLRADGTLWLNMGDSYCSTDKWGGGVGGNTGKHTVAADGEVPSWAVRQRRQPYGLKPKDLVGMPWRLAFALQADGWYLRCDIIWAKPNCMPESVTDRPTKAHEYLFLLSKRATYYYDADAIREPDQGGDHARNVVGPKDSSGGFLPPHQGIRTNGGRNGEGRNKRSVWTIATQPYPSAHFATFPEALVEPCILAGSRPEQTVLDPFAGSGTTLAVAKRLNRNAVGIELNPAYLPLIARRCRNEGAQTAMLA